MHKARFFNSDAKRDCERSEKNYSMTNLYAQIIIISCKIWKIIKSAILKMAAAYKD